MLSRIPLSVALHAAWRDACEEVVSTTAVEWATAAGLDSAAIATLAEYGWHLTSVDWWSAPGPGRAAYHIDHWHPVEPMLSCGF